MGINATYYVIEEADSAKIKKVLIDLIESQFVKSEFLTLEDWKKDRNLFCIGLTPLSCFDLNGSDLDGDHTLITFSDDPIEFGHDSIIQRMPWELISKELGVGIRIEHVYDIVNGYEYAEYRNGQRTAHPGSTAICFYVSPDFYELKDFPGRNNDSGEHFLVFKNDQETFYKDPTSIKKSTRNSDSDVEDIPF